MHIHTTNTRTICQVPWVTNDWQFRAICFNIFTKDDKDKYLEFEDIKQYKPRQIQAFFLVSYRLLFVLCFFFLITDHTVLSASN